MTIWSNFYFLCGSSAAGLTGLMFLAVTYASGLVRKENMDKINVFLSPICFHFVQVFLFCCVASVPTLDARLFGVFIILSGLSRLRSAPNALRVIRRTLSAGADIDVSDWLYSLILPTAVQIALVVTGILYLSGAPHAENLLATCLVSLLAIGVRAAWDMHVWLATRVSENLKGA